MNPESVKKESPKRLPYVKPCIESSLVFERQSLGACHGLKPNTSTTGPVSKRCDMRS